MRQLDLETRLKPRLNSKNLEIPFLFDLSHNIDPKVRLSLHLLEAFPKIAQKVPIIAPDLREEAFMMAFVSSDKYSYQHFV